MCVISCQGQEQRQREQGEARAAAQVRDIDRLEGGGSREGW